MPEFEKTSDLIELALDAGEIGCWVWDATSNRLAWDKRAFVITGAWPTPPKLASFLAAIHPDDRSTLEKRWREAIAEGPAGRFQCEFRLTRPSDGQRRWIAASGRVEAPASRAHQSQPLRLIGVMRDVSDRRAAADNAEAHSARLAGIVAIAADAIISIDDTQTITLFNDGAAAIFGYASDEIIGQPLALLIPEASRDGHAAHIHAFATSGEPSRRMGERGEIHGRRKSGDVFPAEASISRIDVGGERIYTAVLRDITERKQSQAELQRQVDASTRDLRLEMRRREDSQAQLVRTQRMEAFGQLTGGIAHDFNNLLTVITGNLELLEMRLDDAKAKVLLQRAQDAAGMGARLTARLLTFARRRHLAAAPLNVNDLVINMAELLERTIGEQITLTTSLERTPWTVMADPSEIENAILNLAINARDAMPGGGKLIIETANVDLDPSGDDASLAPASRQTPPTGAQLPAGTYVRLSVSDTGIGMSEDVLRRAFEPFFTTKEPGKGTGLGLSSVYGFAQQASGGVTIYSEVGHGSTVNVYLPRIDQPDDIAAPRRDTDAIPLAQGERILLVEDNTDVRAVAQGQLEALGYAVTAAASGPEAITYLGRPDLFDLVLSDVVMPGGMSGLDVARWVRSNAPSLKVVLASGYPEGVLQVEADDAPLPEILRKPFSRANLARTLRRVIDTQPPIATPPPTTHNGAG